VKLFKGLTMTAVNNKFEKLKKELAELTNQCDANGHPATVQLLAEVYELLHISHETFLGNALSSISESISERKI
jgi:phosphohistidine phosphatase SixA